MDSPVFFLTRIGKRASASHAHCLVIGYKTKVKALPISAQWQIQNVQEEGA